VLVSPGHVFLCSAGDTGHRERNTPKPIPARSAKGTGTGKTGIASLPDHQGINAGKI